MPERIQLKRTKGWRMPPDTLKVDRSTKWGNPFVIERGGAGHVFVTGPGVDLFGILCGNKEGAQIEAVRLFRERAPHRFTAELLAEIRGKNLACWCPIGSPCHADVLLEIANK